MCIGIDLESFGSKSSMNGPIVASYVSRKRHTYIHRQTRIQKIVFLKTILDLCRIDQLKKKGKETMPMQTKAS